MIKINIENTSIGTTKAFNPTDLVIKRRGPFSTYAAYGSGENRTSEQIEEIVDVTVFPSTGDQRIWIISNLTEEGGAIDLYLDQYRVIGFKVVSDLLDDSTKIVPISIGLQFIAESTNSAYFLVDLDLRQITLINHSRDNELWLNEDDHGPDILQAISNALALPNLTEAELPIELREILECTDEKRVVNLK
jgi:hypothetical protein